MLRERAPRVSKTAWRAVSPQGATEKPALAGGFDRRPVACAALALGPERNWVRDSCVERFCRNRMRRFTASLVFRDSSGCNPILRVRPRQRHRGCRSILRCSQPVKADSGRMKTDDTR
jgi:hypothetical protein